MIMLKDTLRQIVYRLAGQDAPDWLDSLSLQEDGPTLRVTFPHRYFGLWFRQHKQALFEKALNQYFEGHCPGISYTCAGMRPRAQSQSSPAGTAALFSPGGNSARPASPAALRPEQDIRAKEHREAGPADTAPKDHFASFISNGKNAFPLAAAREIARTRPGQAYNPFLICGHSGTGKTHLLQALADSFAMTGTARMYHAQAARFCAEQLFPADRPELFWQHWDVLLLDDVQDLCGHREAQHQLAACMDSCQPGRQMIFTHAGPAAALKNLDERLRSRLESGLVVELLEPDLDVRLRYLQALSRERQLSLGREQLLYLAQRCAQFRLLQGLLLKVEAFASMQGRKLSQTDLENIVRTGGADKTPGCREILDSVAHSLHLRPEDILGDKRQQNLVLARQLAMFLCRQKLGLSYPELGRAFGGKDHSTVIHAIKKINKLIVSDKSIRQLVQQLSNNAHQQVT